MQKMTNLKRYRIYAKDKCLFDSVAEEDFSSTWNTLTHMVGLIQTEYNVEDLSYEEFTISSH
jgi:hypothetical protein